MMHSNPHSPLILGLVDGLKRKSSVEFAGPCPWCGGEDRFVAWPNQGQGGRFMCRRCARSGDTIDLLRDRGLSFSAAKARVANLTLPPRGPLTAEKPEIESTMWVEAANQFITSSIQEAESEWEDLLKMRQLSKETALRFGIGWNSRDLYLNCRAWGIISEKKLRIPAGLVIPVYQGENLVGMSIRCRDRGKDPKYWQIKGSKDCCLVIGKKGLPVVIVESQLDAYLIWQDAGDLVVAISLNGANKQLDEYAQSYISAAPQVFIATDFDDHADGGIGPGQRALFEILKELPGAKYLPPAVGKDPSDMASLGVPVRQWINAEICPRQHTTSLPGTYPGTKESLFKDLAAYPHLVPCPKAGTPWNWIYRHDCASCSGHIQCVKDLAI